MIKALKRSLSLLLAVAIIFSSAYVGLSEVDFNGLFAVRAEAASESDLTFTLNEDGESYSVTDCEESVEGEIVIPATYNDLPVTSIGHNAFYNCTNLTAITIPVSIKAIGVNAFGMCENLSDVYAFDLAKWCEIEIYGDSYTSNPLCYAQNFYINGELITDLVIPEGVKSIGWYAFCGWQGVESITIPDSVEAIGYRAFANSSYYEDSNNWDNGRFYIDNRLIRVKESYTGELDIGAETTFVSEFAFESCTLIDSIIVDESNPYFSSQDGILYDESGTILVHYPANKTDTSFTVSDNVVGIGAYAFNDCAHLTSITIPDSVTGIGDGAFYICRNLETLVLPKRVESTNFHMTFYLCENLSSVTIPDGIETLEYLAFAGCANLSSVAIPESMSFIEANSFAGCNKLDNVFYADTEDEWKNIIIEEYNDELLDNVIHYNSTNHVHDYDYDNYEYVQNPENEDEYLKQHKCNDCDATTYGDETYIAIRTVDDLYNVRNDLTANYILMNDIDLTEATAEGGKYYNEGCGWHPIGGGSSYTNGEFAGVFDGNNYAIQGLTINNPAPVSDAPMHIGLFANNAGTIKNLFLEDVYFYIENSGYSDLYVGSIAAHNTGTIEGCGVEGVFPAIIRTDGNMSGCGYARSGNLYVGGVCGSNFGELKSCYNKIELGSQDKGVGYNRPGVGAEYYFGGICGYSEGSISECANIGFINQSTMSEEGSTVGYDSGLGGICGSADGTISDCFNWAAAGVGISNGGTIINSYAFLPGEYVSSSNYLGGTSSNTGCYYSNGYKSSTSYPATSLSLVDMTIKENFESFDFENIWFISENPKCHFPQLRSMSCRFLGHNYEWVFNAEPTCTEEGEKSLKCIACGNIKVTEKAPVTHSYGAWSVTVEATSSSTGEKNRMCSLCGDVETEIVPVIPYGYTPIYTAKQLASIQCGTSKNYILMNDIDLSIDYSSGWKPIGLSGTSPFIGTFDGNGYTISNMYIPDTIYDKTYGSVSGYNGASKGLFSSVNGVIKNVVIENAYIYGELDATSSSTRYVCEEAGLICGRLEGGEISNCVVSGKIRDVYGSQSYLSGADCGGLVGMCKGASLISKCAVYCDVQGSAIIGYLNNNYVSSQDVTIENCYNGSAIPEDFYGQGSSAAAPLILTSYSISLAGDSTTFNRDKGQIINDGVYTTLDRVELQYQETFEGFDFETTWYISENSIYPYPQLKSHVFRDKCQHTYGDWVIDTEATCEADGLKYRTCTACGEAETEVITATGHSYSTEWTIDVAATCTTSGSKSYHCLNCDATTDATEILATGHTVGEWVVTIEPTCSTEGEKTGYCSVCGEACATEAVATLEHNYDENNYEYVQNPENPNEFHKQYECEDCGTTIVDEIPFVLKAIIVESLPDNTSYIEGQEIDTTGLVVKAEFEDGTTAYITNYEISYDNSVAGEQEVTVSCGDATATFTVTFTQKTVVSIAVTKMPDKTTYVSGDSFDNTGMVVTATYDNGLTEAVTGYTVSTLPKTTGTKTLIVTYSGKRVTIQVEVIEKKAVSMTVVEPEKFEYVLGDEFDPTGMVVTVTFNNGSVEEVTDYTIEGFGDFFGVGYVTLKYDELTYDLVILMHSPADSWVIETAATCTENGVKHLYCTECGEIAKTETILATGHDYSAEYTIDVEATCISEGSKSRHCSRCDSQTDVTAIGITAHSYGDYVYDYSANTQTCECTVCGYILTEQIPTEGIFTFVLSDDGTYYILSDCSEAAAGVIEIPSTHKGLPVTIIGKRALGYCVNITSIIIPDSIISIYEEAFVFCEGLTSVTFEGNMERLDEQAFMGCSSLESIDLPYGISCIEEETFGDCFNLKKVTIPNTVTSIGLGAFVTCTSLETIEIPDSVTSIDECAFVECTSLTSIEIPDSVTTLGNAAFGLCSRLKTIKIPESITSLGDETFKYCSSLESVVVSDKLTSIGVDCFSDCIDLKYVFYSGSESEWNEITINDTTQPLADAIIHYNCTDHTYEWVVTTPATCTEYGIKSYVCSYCDLQNGTEVIYATGHSYGEWIIDAEVSCEIDGVKHRTCENCNDTETVTETAIGHQYSTEWTIVSPATCEADGEKYCECIACGNKITKSISALGHDYSEEFTVDVEATCQTEGSKSRHCSRCDSKIDVTVIGITTHNYSDWVVTTPATCETDGERTRECINCDDAITETVGAYGHAYSVLWTTDKTPTCTVEGSKSHHCNRCDAKTDITVIPASGHSFGNWSILENSTCTVNGKKYRMCSVCYSEEVEVITAPGHNYGEWIIDSAADCENDGARHAICDVCSFVNNETVKAYGHDYESVFTVDTEATCTEAGSKSHHCSRCDSIADETVILPLGHHISTMWTIDTEPTCESEGSKSHHCLRCDVVTDVTAIPVASHIYGKWYVVTPATMDTAGVRAHKCYNCEMTEEAELPKLLKYTATFVADGDIVATVDFPEDATEIEIPEVPHKDKYNGEWENFDVQNKNFTINAVYTPISTDDMDGIKANNTADYYSSTGEVEVNLNVSAPGKTVITTTTKAIPLDIVFVLDQSGSMAENGKKDALKTAVTTFSNAILEDAISNSVDHRIAVVGFASGGNDWLDYENTELLTADVVKYNKLLEADYKNALVSVNNNGALNRVITKAVNAIDAEGATKADLGLEMASNIFANNPVTDNRQRVVVFLTDGVPTSYSNFEYGVANAAIQNAYQLKDTYDATVYSVGVFDEDTSSSNSVNNFMNYVSSNYNEEKVMEKKSTETSENTNGYYLSVSDVSTLSDVFTSIVEETVTHTGKFTNATLKYTLSQYFTLTSIQEDALRLSAIESLGVANDEISITRNTDGTTTIVISNIEPWANGEDQVIDFTFRATANENTLKSGTYQVGTYDSGVILENGEGFEAVFAPKSVDIGGTSGIAVFNINNIPYAINRLSSTTKVTAPSTDFGADYSFTGWSVPATLVLNNEVRVFDAELTKNEYKISWNIDGEIIDVTYSVGDFISVPVVGNNSIGGAFVGWDKDIPETMPSENLTITAIYDAHYHKYDVTKDFETCDQGGTLTYTCGCGDTYTEEIAPAEHTWEAITGATNHKQHHSVGFRCTVCGVQDDKDLDLERKDKKENADNSHNTATYEFDYVDDNGDKHQPEGDVEISVQLDDVFEGDIPEDANASVYRVNDDGSRTKLPCEQNGMNMKFKTDHFSTYEFEFTTGEQKYLFAQIGTEIDYTNKFIFSDTYLAREFISLVTYLAPASLVANKNSYGYLATGTSVDLVNGDMTDNFKVIINGDLNGDSVCDVLDASYAALVSSGKKTASQDEIYAANGEIADEIDILDYQSIVNKAVS